MPGRIGRGRPSWTLLALASSYAVLVAGPLWSARGALSGALSEFLRAAGGLPEPVAIGVALLGAAALVFVVAQLVRDVELRPYASIAPVLAVFSGLVLSGLRAQLPFPDISGPQLGLSGLTLALVGGALVAHRELVARVLGCVLAALPTFALTFSLAAVRGDHDPLAMIQAADAPLRAYLTLLAVSSLALALVGRFAHFLGHHRERDVSSTLPLTPSEITPITVYAPGRGSHPSLFRQTIPMAGAPHYESPAAFAAAYVPGSYMEQARTSHVPDDPELHALTRKRLTLPLGWLAAATLGLVLVAGYFVLIKPEQARLAAYERARALREVQARADLAGQRDAQGDRLSRYYRQREQEQRADLPLGTVPVVTPLAPTPPAEEVHVEEAPPKPERSHRHHHRKQRGRADDEPASDPKPTLEASGAKPRVQNDRDLDLDDLLHNALNRGSTQPAADDPILGI